MPAVRVCPDAAPRPPGILPPRLERLRLADVALAAVLIREIHQAGRRAVRRRLEIRPAADRRRHDVPRGARLRSRRRDRPAVGVEAAVPRLRGERRRREELSVGAIEHVEMPVAIGVHQQLARFAVKAPVDQHHVLVRVPVVRVVRRELEVPPALARRRIERDHGAGEQVVALAYRAVVERTRVADRPIQQIQLRVVRTGQPGRATAELPRIAGPRVVAELAGPGNRRKTPEPRAGRRIVRVDEAADPELAAGDAGDDLVLERQRRAGDAESLHRIRHLDFPEQRAGAGVQRQERRVQRADEQAVAEDRHAAVERVDLVRVADLLRALIAPDLAPGRGVQRDDDARRPARIHDAVDHERRRFEHRAARQLPRPRARSWPALAVVICCRPE